MEDIIDLIATDSSAADISDRIKQVLYNKAAERIELTVSRRLKLIKTKPDKADAKSPQRSSERNTKLLTLGVSLMPEQSPTL